MGQTPGQFKGFFASYGRMLRRKTSVSMPHQTEDFVIRGVTLQGKRFRPSDWAERLCGVMSQFGATGRMTHSPHVYPVLWEGVKCVVVKRKLYEIEPMAYAFLVGFARDNELEVRPTSALGVGEPS